MDKLYTTARKILDDTHTHRSASEYRAVCAQDPTIPKLELFTDETEGQDIFEDYIDVLEKLLLLVSTSVNDIYFEGWHETVGMALDRCCCEEQHYVGVWEDNDFRRVLGGPLADIMYLLADSINDTHALYYT